MAVYKNMGGDGAVLALVQFTFIAAALIAVAIVKQFVFLAQLLIDAYRR